jgi:hypothetical protein
MSYSAWPTPTEIRAIVAGHGVTLPAAVSDSLISARVEAIAKMVQRETRRELIPVSASRYFDGSGTGELDVNDFISISEVKVVGIIGTPQSSILNWCEIETALSPKNRIAIARGSYPAFSPVWLTAFPEGRRNIYITGVWGFASTIPEDLWLAVAEFTAAQFIDASSVVFGAAGTMSAWEEADVKEKFEMSFTQSDRAGFNGRMQSAIERYKKPASIRIRRQHRRMV